MRLVILVFRCVMRAAEIAVLHVTSRIPGARAVVNQLEPLTSRLALPLAARDEKSAVAAFVLAEGCVSPAQGPTEVGERPVREPREFPAIVAYRLRGALCHADSSCAVVNGRLLVPSTPYPSRQRFLLTAGHFTGATQEAGVVRTHRRPKHVERALCLIGDGAFNWYHWLIEILPAAMLSRGLPGGLADWPLLVPPEVQRFSSFSDSLELFRDGREVIVMDEARRAWVDDAVFIDPASHGPFNMQPGLWPALADYAQHLAVLRAHRAAILERLGVVSVLPTRRIFLVRRHGRRDYNEGELLRVAEAFGFEAVSPETLGFREQVTLFHESAVVIGASGAAWANMLFCQPGAVGLSWLIRHYRGFCGYSNLALVPGVELRYLFIDPLRPVRSTGDGYSAGYRLPIEAFERALAAIVARRGAESPGPVN